MLPYVFFWFLCVIPCIINTQDTISNYCNEIPEVHIVTVATEMNDPLQRFLRSAKVYNYHVEVIGMGQSWKGGDVTETTGGGQKINLLKNHLMNYLKPDSCSQSQKNVNKSDALMLFIDSYDTVLMQPRQLLLDAYQKMGGGVIFGAEGFCWPDKTLAEQYPEVSTVEKRYLNSGGFIGPVASLYQIVTASPVLDADDDQLYYTKIFLSEEKRNQLDIKLDTRSRIFQNLNGAFDEVELRFTDESGYLYNNQTDSIPIVAHGNGPIKNKFNSLSNYLAHSWTPSAGCLRCKEDNIDVNKAEALPEILLNVQVDQPTPFLDVFLERIAALTYPKNRIHLRIYVATSALFQRDLVEKFNVTYGHEYKSYARFDDPEIQDVIAAHIRSSSFCLAMEKCDFMMTVNGIAHITKVDTIEHLLQSNRSMIAPMLLRRGKYWSNFWGALSQTGYYERSNDYMDIAEGNQRGLWIVPLVRDAYLISRSTLVHFAELPTTNPENIDMVLAAQARSRNIFMMVDNREYFGYLMDPEMYTTNHRHNDLWQLFTNPQDWEEQYIRPEYFSIAKPEVQMEDIEQPCPDVFWFPMLTDKFCSQLIEEMEFFGQWSDGSNNDSRLQGGYENVPTRDIHMNQVNWEKHWIHVQQKYVYPMQKKVYAGYTALPSARMNFVVRYRPDEQASLQPHHDASSYSLNIALNRYGIDYQGGGINYIRYNCSIIETRLGWVVMNPGRVTHLHEGLQTTAGTRYIFVTFVNP